MDLQPQTIGTQIILEGTPNTPLLTAAEDVVDIVGMCFNHKARSVLLYAENLPKHFFDLSSGEAGIILQKLRTYHIRLAVVVSPETHQTAMFRNMAAEENKGNDFRTFDSRNTAEDWLSIA